MKAKPEKKPLPKALMLCLLAAAIALTAGGCARWGFSLVRTPPPGDHTLMSDQELTKRLQESFRLFAAEMMAAMDTIQQESDSLPLKSRAVAMKVRTIPTYSALIAQSNPRMALMDALSFTLGLARILEGQGGREFFGPHHEMAARVARRAKDRVLDIADDLMPQSEVDALVDEITRWLEENQPDDATGMALIDEVADFEDPRRPMPEKVLSIPLSPYTIIEGLDAATQAVREITRVGDRIAQVAEYSPFYGRWFMELLLYDLMESQPVDAMIQSAASLAESLSTVTALAVDLSGDAGSGLDKILADVDARLEETSGLLEHWAANMEQTQTLIELALPLAQANEQAMKSLEQAGIQWDKVLGGAQGTTSDFARAVEDLRYSADKMDALAQRLMPLVNLAEKIEPEAFFRQASTRTAILAILVILVFFGALFLYRVAMEIFLTRKNLKNREA
jgi:hypothetical protein